VSLSVTFLGTAASRPTVERSVSALALVREGETFLVDCGEGTQRQMMRYGVSFVFGDLLLTHLHGDHVFGIAGLLKTMALQDREPPLRVWGPRGTAQLMRRVDALAGEALCYPVQVAELAPGERIARDGYAIEAFAVDHKGAAAIGFALVEQERRGRFDPERARALGVPEGPLWGRIHKGESVTLDDGRVVAPETLVGPTRPGRTLVVSGDTRPCTGTAARAAGADLLVHEATFGDEEAERARETGHSTAREAAVLAREAGVRRLVLTHLSARYSRDASALEREAREEFAATVVAKDGMAVEVPFGDEQAGG
jgi:ribonuclease Z